MDGISSARRLFVSLRSIPGDLARYLFSAEGRISFEIGRMAVALSLILSFHTYLAKDYQLLLETFPPSLFEPKGILRLWGGIPDAPVLEVVKHVAILSTCFMFVGLFSRISTITSFIANLILLDVLNGFASIWSIYLNIVLLAHMVYAFAPGNSVLGLDPLVRRLLGLRARTTPAGNWPVYACQFVICMMFFNAVIYKLMAGGPALDWVFSDSLRNYLIYRSHLLLQGPSALQDTLIGNQWLYKGAALANVVAQLVPIAALFLWRYPRLRAACGLVFLVETLALGLVMGLWNWNWAPLCAFFVDWEKLVSWRRTTVSFGPDRAPSTLVLERAGEVRAPARSLLWKIGYPLAFLTAFFGWFLHIAFRDPYQTTKTYPFTGWAMFSPVFCDQPYRRHQDFCFTFAKYSFNAEVPESHRLGLNYWSTYNASLAFCPNLDHIASGMRMLQKQFAYDYGSPFWDLAAMPIQRTWEVRARVRSFQALAAAARAATTPLELKKVIYRFPAYPARGKAEIVFEGLVAVLDRDGSLSGVIGHKQTDEQGRNYFTLASRGLDHTSFRFYFLHDNVPELKELEVERDGARYYYQKHYPGTYKLIVVSKTKDAEQRFFGPDL